MLVGRETERRTIEAALAGARIGESRVLVLGGEPGIGKTALLEEAAALASEMRVLRARGVESERLVPFAGLSQLLRPVLPLLDQVPPAQAAALSSALLLADAVPGERPTRFAVGAATLSLLSRAAEDRPLAVLVDDGHLVDDASAEALVFAARRLLTDPVAVLVTVRAGEPGAEVWSPLTRLDLTGLDLAATGRLLGLATRGAPGDRLLRLHRATGGNPLALLELGDRAEAVDAAPADSPLGVSDQVSRAFIGRADGLGEGARTALLVAATDAASAATVHDACRALGVTGAGLTEAEEAGLVTVRGDRLEFRHPLVRSAVYAAATPEQRRAAHRALAGVVPPHESDRLAWHLAEGAVAPDEATAATLERVAQQAAERGAYAIAATAHERAAELGGARPERGVRLVAAAEAAWLAGQTGRATELLDRALACHPEPRVRAHAQELRGAVQTRCGSLADALVTLVEAADDAAGPAPEAAVRLYSDAIHACFYLADPAAAMRCCRAIERLLEHPVDPESAGLAGMATGMALVLAGRGPVGIERVREALHSLVVPAPEVSDLYRHPLRLQGALWLRERGAMRDEVNRAIERLRERSALGSLPYVLMQIGRDAATADRWDDAESAYVEGIRLARETGQTTDLAMSLGGLATLLGRRGRAAECLAAAAEAEEIAERNSIRIALLWALLGRGDLAAGAGDTAAAAGCYERLEGVLARTGFGDPDQSCAPELAEAYVHLGRGDDACRVAAEHRQRALAKAQPWALARAERATALCTADPAAADESFRAALALHAETPDVYEAARTQLAYGAWLRRHRRRIEARPVLRSALETFELVGAVPWADRAAHELRATGESAHRRDLGPVEQLTPQERQIAQLLAAGRTTREAAAALFLSPKTVEYHLRHVYLKLGIRSRAELAAHVVSAG